MLKFLRRYQKWILAVGGSLLMVAFLLPQALQRWGRTAFSRVEATYVYEGKEHTIPNEEWQQALIEFAVLHEQFGGELAAIMNPKNLSEDDPDYLQVVNASHWYLLKLAAEKAGLTSTAYEGESYLRQYAAQLVLQNPDLLGDAQRAYDMIMQGPRQALAGRQGTDKDIHRAIANFLAVSRLVQLYETADVAATWRVQDLLDQFERTINASMLFLRADEFTADIDDPSESELQEHFDKYKANAPGDGEYGIGYLQPDRVKIEYLVINYDSLFDSITVTGKDARKWYAQNKDNLELFPLRPDQTEAPPYEEVREGVITSYRHLQTEQKAREVINFVKARLLRSTQGLKRDGDYRALPDDWADKRLSFESLRDQLIEEFGTTVTYHADADGWLRVDELTRQPSIGSAVRRLGTRDVRISELIGSLREFGNVTTTGLQVGLTNPEPLRVMTWERNAQTATSERVSRDIVYYRVLAANGERPARDVDEVRDVIVDDYKRIKAFNDLLKDDVETWRAQAVEQGLDALAEERSLQVRSQRVKRYDRTVLDRVGWMPTPMGLADRDDDLAEAIYDQTRPWDVLTPADEHEMADRVVVCPIPSKLCLAIARIDSITPMTRESWQQVMVMPRYTMLSSVSDLVAGADRGYRSPKPFSFDALKDRFQYEMQSRGAEELPEEGMGTQPDDGSESETGQDGEPAADDSNASEGG
ncbi:MAG: hypothetical protein D8M59_15065 [Planctomycetes bacterium]|nr:hypothetical protein [Planctomycetota bacterium]NOG52829.1 hypothetical protein [Planctomycetota bacterium]